MLLEWNRWLEGMTTFKEYQGLLWIFVLGLFTVLWYRGRLQENRLMICSAILAVCTVFPLSAMILLKGFTPFYDWMDLHQVFPMMLLLAVLAVEVTERFGKATGLICVGVLLLVATGFHGFDKTEPADVHGVPAAYAEAFESLDQMIDRDDVVIAAKADLLQYVRLYDATWQPLFGRDLWNGKSASYINSGYDVEYAYYTFLEQAELKDKAPAEFIALVQGGEADCIIVPYYWKDAYSQIPGYQLHILTESYNVIIKEDLVVHE